MSHPQLLTHQVLEVSRALLQNALVAVEGLAALDSDDQVGGEGALLAKHVQELDRSQYKAIQNNNLDSDATSSILAACSIRGTYVLVRLPLRGSPDALVCP